MKCPNCRHTWPATEADLGLQKCPSCGIALKVKRVAVAWSHELQYVATKADEPS